MALIDTLVALAGGGALAEGLRYLRARATTHAASVAATERTGRHAVADRAAHVEQLLHRVERLESQRDEAVAAIAELRVACAHAEGKIAELRHELEDTREELADTRLELSAAIARAVEAEQAREELREEVEELRSRPLSNPPVASGD